jgi:signal transduction histidine kinase
MRVAPQSLFARLLAALLGVVGITLTVIVVLIMQDRRELALRVGGVWNTSSRIAEITNHVGALNGAQRSQEIERLIETPVVVGQMDLRVLRRRPDMAHLSEKFADQVRRQLGKGYKVDVTPAQPEKRDVIRMITNGAPRLNEAMAPPGAPPDTTFMIVQHDEDRPVTVAPAQRATRMPPDAAPDGPEFMVRTERGEVMTGRMPPPGIMRLQRRAFFIGLFDVNVSLPDGGSLTFRVAPPWPEPPLPVRIFLELGILTLALGLALFFTTRSITRPLSNLARAADAVGRSVRHPRLIEEGASEIRNATRAFNAMQDRLLRYLDSRTRVLAAMSHDLKTPLTRLRLRVESVSDSDLRERFGSDLDEMESLVHGALGLFKGLDDEETFESIDVNALLHTVESEFTEMGAQVSVSGAAASPVPVKPRALKRCLTNLVENAVKFGSRADLIVEDGPALVIRVRDDGPGIPIDSLEQVFEPFFRLESSRSRDTGGTGLGLTIARDVAQAHGGTLILNNLPERGLEAVLTIPRTARDDDRIPHRVRP